MKNIESAPRGLSPEEIKKIIESYRPLLTRVKEERRFRSDLHRHIMGNAAPLMNESTMRLMLEIPENLEEWQDNIKEAANKLERYFRWLDENPEMAKELRERGYEAFPSFKEDSNKDAEHIIKELERIVEK